VGRPRIFTVDAFSERPFAGNPAGVVLYEEELAGELCQSVAAEMRHSETAFVRTRPTQSGEWPLRWFTPTTEVDLCGHATLASATVMWAVGCAKGEIRFATRSGTLVARPIPGGAELDLPRLDPTEIAEPAGLAAALGARVTSVHRSRFDWLVELGEEEEVRELSPDLDALRRLECRGVIVTARAEREPADFVSRFFAPSAGIDEDPVTGSAHCVLAPYWAARTGRTELVGRQLSSRSGTVAVEVADERVRISGAATIVLSGELLVDLPPLSSGEPAPGA
jgi:predicted PhzF superfamily epimerase YddE/YHI9